MIRVTLTQREIELARFVALQRDVAGNKAKADAAKYGNETCTFDVHVRWVSR